MQIRAVFFDLVDYLGVVLARTSTCSHDTTHRGQHAQVSSPIERQFNAQLVSPTFASFGYGVMIKIFNEVTWRRTVRMYMKIIATSIWQTGAYHS